MAISLEEKKQPFPLQKILIAILVISAVLALFIFGSKSDLFKEKIQSKKETPAEVKKISLDVAFLDSNIITNLKPFPSFPTFFGTSTTVEPGRENPFAPYQKGDDSKEKETVK